MGVVEGACGTAGDAVRGRGGGMGVAVKWLSLDRRSFDWVIAMAIVVGAGSRDGAEVGTQVRTPPWPNAARHARPDLYLAFSASGSALQRWPGAHVARRQGWAREDRAQERPGEGAAPE